LIVFTMKGKREKRKKRGELSKKQKEGCLPPLHGKEKKGGFARGL